jgi:hypothetical protein
MLDASMSQMVRVVRDRQGYLSSQSPFMFQLQPSILSISPIIGRFVT